MRFTRDTYGIRTFNVQSRGPDGRITHSTIRAQNLAEAQQRVARAGHQFIDGSEVQF